MISHRRRFLRALGAGPLLAAAGSAAAQDLGGIRSIADLVAALEHSARREALNISDFERAAQSKMTPEDFAHLQIGAFNNETFRANREGFARYQVRLRRMMGIGEVDQSVRMFGVTWPSPIFLCPVGGVHGFYPEGDVVAARAARARNVLQILSNSWPVGANPDGTSPGTRPFEEVNAARGGGIWFNIRRAPDEAMLAMIRRLEGADCPAVVWTVDVRPLGPPLDGRTGMRDAPLTWDDVRRVRRMTRMKLLLKGIVAREDAALAVEHGVDGIIVSTHGGHQDAGGRGAIECLPEVVAGAAGKVPVLMDGGVRGGADIFKALALGATAVGVGRAYIWALAALGQEGVETAIDILRRELEIIMAQAGASSIAGISRASLVTRA